MKPVMDVSEAQAVERRFRDFVARQVADPKNGRQNHRTLSDGFVLAPDVVFESMALGAVPGEKVAVSESRSDAVLLYLHGGGYVTGDAAAYRHLVADIARATGTTAFAIDYGLAPEYPFPLGIDHAVAAYRALLDKGVRSTRIIVAGDSAGGGLALAMMLTLREQGIPQPAAAWLISPLGDMSRSGETMALKAGVDPISMSAEKTRASSSAYLAEAAADDHRASPVFADLRGLPPLRIDVGSYETLLDDSVRIARQAGLADVETSLHIWPGMVHIFPFFAPILQQGKNAVSCAGAFLRQHVDDAAPNT